MAYKINSKLANTATAVQIPSAPIEGPSAVYDLIDRLYVSSNAVVGLQARVENLADRLFGPHPQGTPEKDMRDNDAALLPRLEQVCIDLSDHIAALEQAITRIERL